MMMDKREVGAESGEQPPSQFALRKYVSVFRIDGEPIIPPLMTSEKRREMQKLKEKALKLEQRWKERKLLLNNAGDLVSEEGLSETSRSSTINPATGSISQRSQDFFDAKLKESEESMMILRDLIRRQSAPGEEEYGRERPSLCYNSSISSESRCNSDKLKKLQKSETVIYDNSTNEVIKQNPNVKQSNIDVDDHRTTEHNMNVTYLQPKKPSSLMLPGINSQGMAIPSICINPPTPLVGNQRQISEPLSDADKKASIFVNQHKYNLPPDDQSSDESFNSMYTHSDGKPPRPPAPVRKPGMPRSENIHDLKAYNNVANVTAKIQQFEAIGSDLSSTRTTPNSSPDKGGRGLTKMGAPVSNMSRSATSPSIKLGVTTTRAQTTTADSTENSPDNALIRSSSFTLEAPSKALIDHMRQQRSISDRPPNRTALTSPLNITRKISSPSRIHRDTIESKAKRVQKVELKPSRQKIQQKASHHKLAQAAAAASMSPYKSHASTSPTFQSHASTSNLYKTKKSPYDTPNYTKSNSQSAKTTSSSQMRRSPSSSVSSVPSQKSSSRSKSLVTTNQTTPVAHQKSGSAETEVLPQMDKMQKEKFLRLLKQQEEEQRKLKQAFEMQQKLLIEQLNKEMAAAQLNSPPLNSPAVPPSSRVSSALTQRSENLNLQISDYTSDYSQQQTNLEYSQPSPSNSVSNDQSSLYSVETITQNFPSDYSQVPTVSALNLSSMDHTNVNTSLESSAMQSCVQSTHRTDSPQAVATKTPLENGHSGAGSANSASRRRLFPQDHMTASTSALEGSIRPLSSRRSASSQRLADSQQQQMPNSPKGGCVGLTNNANNRRSISLDVANAAATTINAYARGYLVRRLFQTEQIQRIVQTMRDTLIFVLNLHLETCNDPKEANTPANIKLKARLLQQLSSACRSLHLVFFQTSVKERMDIIARDRKRIKTKLLAINRKRTPRIAG